MLNSQGPVSGTKFKTHENFNLYTTSKCEVFDHEIEIKFRGPFKEVTKIYIRDNFHPVM